MSYKNDFYRKILGLETINEDGMATDPNPTKNNRGDYNSIFNRGIGEFAGAETYDLSGRNSVIYRDPDQDFEQTAHDSQKWYSESLAALTRLAATTGTKLAQGAGFMAGLAWEGSGYINPVMAANKTIAEGNFVTRAADNYMANFFSGAEEWVKEQTPIFKSAAYRDGNIFQKAGTSEFWSEDVVDGLAFMLSSVMPGGMLSKVGAGTKFAKAVSKGLMRNANGKLTLPNVRGLAKNADKVGITSFMTANEAMFEAKDVRDSILNDESLKSKYTDEEIQKIAADKARDAFYLNMLFIAPSNLFEVSTFFNKTKLFGRSLKSRQKMGIAEKAAGKFEDVSGGFFNKPGVKFAGAMLGNVASEGLYEENIQYSIQKAAQLSAHNYNPLEHSFYTSLQSLIDNRNKMIDLGEDKERDSSILLGGIIGMGTTAAAETGLNDFIGGDGGIFKAEAQKKRDRADLIKKLDSTYQDLTSFDIYDREADQNITLRKDENGFFVKYEGQEEKAIEEQDYVNLAKRAVINPEQGGSGVLPGQIITQDGQPIISTEKLDNLFNQSQKRQMLDGIHSALEKEEDRNKLSLELIRNEKLSNLAIAYFDAGLGETLMDKVDFYSEMTPEELAVFGMEKAEESVQKQRTAELKKFLVELEELYNSVEDGVIPDTNTDRDFKTNEVRKKVLFDRGQRILTLDNLITKNNAEIQKAVDAFGFSTDLNEKDVQVINSIKDAIYALESYKRNVTRQNSLNSDSLNMLNRRVQRSIDNALDHFWDEDSKGYLFGRKDIPSSRDFLRATLINEQLVSQREEMYKDWKDISDIQNGFEYFKNNREKIFKKFSEVTPENQLFLNEKTTKKEYLKWEDRQVKRLKLLQSLEEQDNRLHSQRVRRMLTVFNKPIHEIAEYALLHNVRLPQDIFNLIEGAIRDKKDRQTRLENRIADLEGNIDRLTRELTTYDYIGDDANFERVELEIKDLRSQVEATQLQLEAIKLDEEGVLADGESTLDKLSKIRSKRGTFLSDDDRRMELALEFFQEADLVTNAFEKDREYDDLKSVEAAIVSLNKLAEVFDTRGEDINSRIYSVEKLLKDIINKLDELEQIKQEVEKRLNDKLAKELRYSIRINQEAIDLIKTNFPDLLDDTFTDLVSKIDNLNPDEDGYLIKLASLTEATAHYLARITEFNPALLDTDLITRLKANESIKKQLASANGEVIKNLIDNILQNPNRSISGLLKYFGTRTNFAGQEPGYDATPESSLYQYDKDNNIFTLLEALETEERPIEPTATDLREVVILLKEALILGHVRDITLLTNELNYIGREKSIIEKIKEDSKLKVPSVQQRHIIYNLIRQSRLILSGDKSYEGPFSNFLYLKGPAGSGKTNVVIRWLFALMQESTPEQVFTAGHQEHSAQGIANSIATSHGANTVETLTKKLNDNSLPKTVKFIVIDEIGGVSQLELDELKTAMHKYIVDNNLENNPPVVITMGDPNQITKDISTEVAIQVPYVVPPQKQNEVVILEGVHRVTDVGSLSTRFRTNNPAIVNIQNSFIDQVTEVNGLKGAISVRPDNLESQVELLRGAMVEENTASLMSTLLAMYNKNPNGDYVIVVENNAKVDEYEKRVKATIGEQALSSGHIKILTHIDVQGRTIENVFVDMNYSTTDFNSLHHFNQSVYTATSRAVNFLYLGNHPGGSTVYSPQLLNLESRNEEQLKELKDSRLNHLELLESLYPKNEGPVEDAEPVDAEADENQTTSSQEDGAINEGDQADESAVPEPEVTQSTIEQGVDDRQEEPEGQDIEPVVNVKDPSTKDISSFEPQQKLETNQVLIQEPEYDAYQSIEEGDSMVWPGLGYYFDNDRDINIEIFRTSVPGSSERPDVIIAHPLADGRYVKLGVLTAAEINRFGQNLGVLETDVVTFTQDRVLLTPANQPTNTIKAIIKGDRSNILTYLYGDNYRKFNPLAIFSQWASNFFSKANPDHQIEFANQAEVGNKNNLRVVIYNGKDVANFKGNMIPSKGVPYLEIKGVRRKHKNDTSTWLASKETNTQLIRLTPRRINKNKDSELLTPINEFIEAVDKLQTLLEDKFSWPAKLGTTEFSMIVQRLSNIWAYENVESYNTKPNLEREDKLYGPIVSKIDNVTEQEELLRAAVAVDELVHGAWATRGNKRNHKGLAQQAFDRIARANLFSGLGQDTIMLRDHRQARAADKSMKWVITGRSLLASPDQKKIKYEQILLDQLEAYEYSLESRFPDQEGKLVGAHLPRTRSIKGSGRVTMTLEELQEVFSFDDVSGDSNVKLGFGLRLPIQRKMFTAPKGGEVTKFKTLEDLDNEGIDYTEMFEDNFEMVMPTRMTMEISGVSLDHTPPNEQVKNEEEQNTEDDNPLGLDTDIFNLTTRAVSEQDFDLGEELTKEELTALYRKYLPDTFLRAAKRWVLGILGKSPQEQEFFRIMDAVSLAKRAGQPVWGRYESGVIFLTEGRKGTAFEVPFRHELMHKIVNEYLTPQEKIALFDLAVQENPNLRSVEDVQEYIANRFMNYKESPSTFKGALKRFFEKILRFLGFIRDYNKDLNEFFDKVHRGFYNKQRVSNPNINLNKTILEKWFNSDTELYANAEKTLLNTIARFYDINRVTSIGQRLGPFTFDEAKQMAFEFYEKVYNIYKNKEVEKEEFKIWKSASAVMRNEEVFNMMVDRLYGKQSNKIQGTTEVGALREASVVNLTQEIQEVKYEDPKKRIIQDVKQVLSTIPINPDGTGGYVPFGQAYVILIDALMGLDSSLDSKRMLNYLTTEAFRNHDHHAAGRALKRFMQNLALSIHSDPNTGNVHLPWIEFRNDGVVYIDVTKELDLHELPYNQMDSSDSIVKEVKKEGENQAQFLERVAKKLSIVEGVNNNTLLTQYKFFRNRNNFATIITAVTSMRNREPMVGVREYGDSGLEYSYFPNRLAGTRAVMISDISSFIVTYLNNNDWSFSPFNFNNNPNLDDKQKKNEIFYFLKTIGVDTKGISLGSKKDTDEIYQALRILVREVINAKRTKENIYDIRDVVTTEEKFARLLADLNMGNNKGINPVNYISGGGKRIYTKHNSSYGFEVLKYLQSLWGKGKSQVFPDHFALPFYKSNIFVGGKVNENTEFKKLNNIYKYVDHDSIKYKGIDRSAVEYDKEGKLDWLSRVFNHAFAGYIGKRTNKRYIQFLYPPSNKPNLPGVEIDVLSFNEVKTALETMLAQQQLLPQTDNVANYTPEKNYLPGETVEEIIDYLDQEAENLIEFMLNNNFNVDSKLDAVYKQFPFLRTKVDFTLKDLSFEKAYTKEQIASMSKEEIQEKREEFNKRLIEEGKTLDSFIRPAVRLFMYNFYVNSKQLSQIIAGPEAFYKTGQEPYDIIKRNSIVFAPGRKGAVKDGLYLPRTSKVAVAEDLISEVDFVKGIAQELLGERYEPSDAQGFITPKYHKMLQKSFGLSSELDVTLKPVYFAIDKNGIPRAIKFSLIVLTDDLVSKYPKLGSVRDLMEKGANPVDMFVFKSAVKVGIPNNLTKIYDDNKQPLDPGEIPLSIDPLSIFDIDNRHLRMQHNPAHRPNALTTNPSQLTYMGITGEENLPLQAKIHLLNAELIRMGHSIVDRALSIKDGKTTPSTVGSIRKMMETLWKDLAGSEMEHSLITDARTSFNLPLLVDKVISSLTSKISRETVDFKFKGSKLVLQSEFGTYNADNIGKEPLKWKDENGFTEVYLPQELAAGFNIGDIISTEKLINPTPEQLKKREQRLKELNDKFRAIGFRLPSTGLHSAIALKVKGFYPAPEGSKANVIIAPKRLVYVHGSDFDIDGLFVLQRALVSDISENGLDYNLGYYLKEIDDKYNPDLVLEANNVINYNSKLEKQSYDINGYPSDKGLKLHEFLAFVVEDLSDKISDLSAKNPAKDSTEWDYIIKLKEQRERIQIIYANAVKNEIVDTFIAMIISPLNRELMELPITMNRLKGVKTPEEDPSMLDIVAEMRGVNKEDFVGANGNFNEKSYEEARNKVLYPDIDLSNPLDQMQIHYNTFAGNSLTGAGANSFKSLAYIFAATRTQSWVDEKEYLSAISSGKSVKDIKQYSREHLIDKSIEWIKKNQRDDLSPSVNIGLMAYSEEGIDLLDYKKELPEVKNPITINGVEYGTLSFKEKGKDGKDHEVVVGRDPKGQLVTRAYSIWETLDSLVNAAIDNVKEQILYILNINDKTANQVFAMVGLGIPMSTVTRIMNQPAILDISEKDITDQVIRNSIDRYKSLYAISNKIIQKGEELKEDQIDQINKEIEAYNLSDQDLTTAAVAHRKNPKGLQSGDFYLTQIKTLETFQKATELGDALFLLSRSSQILRKYPGKYSDLKNTLEEILDKISTFGEAKAVRDEKERIKDEIRDSEAYQAITNPKERGAYMRREMQKRFDEEGLEEMRIRTTYNQLMRGNHTGYNTVAGEWPFSNASLLSVPNFKQAVRGLMKIVRVYEHLFFKHSGVVNDYVRELLKDIRLRERGNKWERVESIKNELITFLNTAISFNIAGQRVDLSIPENYRSVSPVSGREEYGFKGWTNDLVKRIQKLKKEHSGNSFLDHIEFGWDSTYKENTIIFTSDKVSDPVQALIFKLDFEKLSQPEFREEFESPDTKYSKLQIDLFKYLALSRGTSFGRTSYASLIPDEIYKAFDEEANAMYKLILLSDDKHVNKSKVLEQIFDQFLLQYVQNNPGTLYSLDNGNQAIITQEDGKTLKGVHEGKHYDIKTSKDFGKFIKFYRGIYFRSFNDAEGNYYYQKVSNIKRSRYYSLSNPVLSRGFDINKVFNGTPIHPKLIPNGGLIAGNYIAPARLTVTYKKGEIIYLSDSSDIGFTKLDAFKITGEAEKVQTNVGDAYKYPVEFISRVQTFYPQSKPDFLESIPVDSDTRNVKNAYQLGQQAAKNSITYGYSAGQQVSSKDIIKNLLEDPNVNEFYKDILRKYDGFLPSTITFNEVLRNKRDPNRVSKGVYFGGNIHVSLADINSVNDLAETVTHELTHLYTVSILERGKLGKLKEGSKELEWFNNMKEMYEIVKNDPAVRLTINSGRINSYFISSLEEFAAHIFTNKTIAEQILSFIPYKNETVEDRPKTLWDKFITWLKNLFFTEEEQKTYTVFDRLKEIGIPDVGYIPLDKTKFSLNLTYNTTINSLINNVTVRGEGTSINEPQFYEARGYDLMKKMAAGEYNPNEVPDKLTSLDSILTRVKELNPQLTDDELAYIDNNNLRYRRLTELTNADFTTSSRDKDNLPEILAARDFSKKGLSEDQIFKDARGEEFTFAQRVNYYLKSFNTGKSKGRYAHAYIEFLLETDANKKQAIAKRLREESMAKKDENGVIIKDSYTSDSFKWIEDHINLILKRSGINKNRDRILSEQIIMSPTLGIATRADGIIEHPDGVLSLIDWKSGGLTSDLYTSEVLQYGEIFGLNNSKLNRAKLEVMFRALIMKEIDPTTIFNQLTVNHLNRTDKVKIYHVEVEQFLKTIENYVKKTNPDAYKTLSDKGLFDPSIYRNRVNIGDNWKYALENKSPEEQRQWIEHQILKINLEKTPAQIEAEPSTKLKLAELTKMRAELSHIKYLDFNEEGPDLGTVQRYVSNIKDVGNAWAVAFKDMFLSKKERWIKAYRQNEETNDKLLKEVVKDYLATNGMASALSAISRGSVNYLPILGGLNKRKLYAFMWRYYEGDGLTGWHANLKDTYYNEDLGREVDLTEAQKKYRDNYHRTLKGMFKQTLIEPLFDEFGKKVTKAKIQGLPTELYDQFMPRAPQTMSDIAELSTVKQMASKGLKSVVQDRWLNFLEGNTYGNRNKGVPLRYYAGLDSEIVQSENFSFDADNAYKLFTRNLLFKKEMDDVYAFGKGINAYLTHPDRTDENGNPKYPNLVRFIEDHILLHVIKNNPSGSNLMSTESKIPISKAIAESAMGKALGLQEGYLHVNKYKLAMKLKNFTSLAGMALKPIRGAFNGALIIISNHLKGISGSIAKMRGVEGVDYTFSDVLFADKLWAQHVGHGILKAIGAKGKDEHSKLWNITQKFNFLPDNYDFKINQDDQTIVKNSLFDRSNLYWFHTIFENYGSMTMLAATLKAMKVKNEKGKVVSMWDLYDNEGNYTGPVRGRLEDGSELKGLDAREIGHLKRIYERIHGSYRQEERLALELSILGQWALQFKKYLPTIFKMQFKGRGRDYSLGSYKIKTDENGKPIQENGMNVYEWESKLTQGRVNLMMNMLFSKVSRVIGKDTSTYADEYTWENLSDEQKQNFTEGMVLFTTMVLAPFLLLENLIDDDDENKRWARAFSKLAEDISLGMNLGDLIRPIERPFPALGKVLDLYDYSVEFFTEGLLRGETDSRDLPKGLYPLTRTVPLGSALHQWNSFLEEIDKKDSWLIRTRLLQR